MNVKCYVNEYISTIIYFPVYIDVSSCSCAKTDIISDGDEDRAKTTTQLRLLNILLHGLKISWGLMASVPHGLLDELEGSRYYYLGNRQLWKVFE